MSDVFQTYNPTSPVGIYNIKKFAYENKTQVYASLGTLLVLVMGVFVVSILE